MDAKTLLNKFLGQLKPEELKSFIWNLTNPGEDGLSDIPPGELPCDSKRRDVVDMIVETHENDPITVTCRNLRKIGKNKLATDLEKKAVTLGLKIAPPQDAFPPPSQAAFPAPSQAAFPPPSKAAFPPPSQAAFPPPSQADIEHDDGSKQGGGQKYKMDSMPRGVCVIINNGFKNDAKPRTGTEKDAKDLTEVFSWLGFKVVICEEKTKQHMSNILELLSKLDPLAKNTQTPSQSSDLLIELRGHEVKEWDGSTFVELKELPRHGDAFVCCILSHGNKEGVQGVDRETLPNDQISAPFFGKRCPALAGKPKLFIIQACRGASKMDPVSVQADNLGEPEGDLFLDLYESGNFETDDDDDEPDGANFLIARAVVSGFISVRAVNPAYISYGSWFIQILCDQLRVGCERGDDVYIILQKVNDLTGKKTCPLQRVKFGPHLPTKQAPEFTSSMGKALVFTPHPYV